MADAASADGGFNRALVLPIFLVAVTALALGYDGGVMSGAALPISQEFELDVVKQGIMMGILNIMAAPGALLGSWVADLHGRVPASIFTAFLLLVGPLIIALSPNFLVLMAGRVITGVGIGFAFVIPPVYAAELAPPAYRGRLIVATEILISLGVVLGYLSAVLLHVHSIPEHWRWRIVIGLAALPAALVLGSSPLLPESPRWLAKQGRWDEVQAVLQQLYTNPVEIKALQKSIQDGIREEQAEAGWGQLLCPSVVTRRMLVVGLGIAFFQQACGSEAIVYYSPSILGEYGIDRVRQQNRSTILIGLAKLLGSVLCGTFLDSVGRRPGVIVSSGGCALVFLALAHCLQQQCPAYVALLMLCLFKVLFEIGLAGGAFVLGTETYPVTIRAKALALSMFTTRFLSGLVSMLFPAIVAALTLKGAFLFFSGMCFLGTIWAQLYVHETSGMKLEEVAKLFEDRPQKSSYGSIPD